MFYSKFTSNGQLLSKHLHILHMDQENKNIFTPQPMAAYRSECKLNSYLVRTKLYPWNELLVHVNVKKKRCEVCLNVQETCFTNSMTNKVVDNGVTCCNFQPQAQKPKKNYPEKISYIFSKKNFYLYLGMHADQA